MKVEEDESGLKVIYCTKVSVERIKCLKKIRIIVFKHNNLEQLSPGGLCREYKEFIPTFRRNGLYPFQCD
jgi:hypothetical protein